MVKTLLIFPESPKGSVKVEMPSPGLAYIASFLKNKDISVEILDLSIKKVSQKKFSKLISDKDFIGIYTNETVVLSAFKVASLIKKINKKVKVVAGGPLSTIFFKEVIKKDFDFAVAGEGEQTFYELISGKDVGKIKGLAYKKGKKIIFNGYGRNLDINQLPFPDFTLYGNLKKYSFLRRNNLFIPLITSRGCPYSCAFCSVKKSIGTWRGRDVNNVINEIIYQKEKHGVKEFAIMDDNLTLDIKRFEKLCDELIKRKLNIKWQCPNGISAEGLTRDLIKKMRKSGCWALAFAPEVGNEKIRKQKLGKNISNEQFKKVTKWSNEEGIFTIGFFIIGFPWESEEDIKETEEFIRDMGCDMAQIKTLIPFYGSSLGKMIKNNEKINFDFCKSFNDMRFCMETKCLSIKELEKRYKSLYFNVYTPQRSAKILYKLLKNRAYYGVAYYIKNSVKFLLNCFH